MLFAATSPDAATGRFLGPSRNKRDTRVHLAPIVPPGDDPVTAARLWSLSERLTGVPYLPPPAPAVVGPVSDGPAGDEPVSGGWRPVR